MNLYDIIVFNVHYSYCNKILIIYNTKFQESEKLKRLITWYKNAAATLKYLQISINFQKMFEYKY